MRAPSLPVILSEAKNLTTLRAGSGVAISFLDCFVATLLAMTGGKANGLLAMTGGQRVGRGLIAES